MSGKMTPDQLFQETGNFYQCLIHPVPDDPEFQAGLDRFCQLREALDRDLVLQLIKELDWRSRLLGYAVAALNQDWSLSSEILATLSQPTGLTIVPAGAWLIIQHQRIPEWSPDLDLTEFDLSQFDGEVGWGLSRVRSAHAGTLVVADEETGPHSGQSLQDQLALYESLCKIG